MLSRQLSIFLENKSGRLAEVTKVLGQANINISAMSIADNSDFGILRCVVSDPDKAYKELKAAGFTLKITDVIGFTCPNTPGALAAVVSILADKGISLEYMYSFSLGQSAYIVIRPSDLEACQKILAENKVALMAADDLYRI